MLPYANMIAYSYQKLTSQQSIGFTVSHIENTLRWFFQDLTLAKWGEAFSEWVKSHLQYTAIFVGTDPYNNANLKVAANIGSKLFDSMSVIFATAYQIGNIKRTNSELAPDGTMVDMYDNLFKYHSFDNSWSALDRNWNNKGNTMETLAMTMFEDDQNALLWFTASIALHGSYQHSALPNIVQI